MREFDFTNLSPEEIRRMLYAAALVHPRNSAECCLDDVRDDSVVVQMQVCKWVAFNGREFDTFAEAFDYQLSCLEGSRYDKD